MQIGVRQPRIRGLLTRLFTAALDAVHPARSLGHRVSRRGTRLEIDGRRYDLDRFQRIRIVGAGKAAATMAAALEHLLGDRLDATAPGLVVVKPGHQAPLRRVRLLEAGHPVPNAGSARAAQAVLRLVQPLHADDLLLVLLSGGTSSLLAAPVPGLTLSDKQRTTQLLLRSGASIRELNVVRKHLSAIKGGRLLAATSAHVVSLILSDVLGDDLATIGSGPTVPDPSRFADACEVLERYGLWPRVPAAVRRHLLAGRRGAREETPKPGAAVFERVQNVIIGNNHAAVAAVARTARRLRLRPLVLSTSVTGEAREVAKLFGALAREIDATGRPLRRPACVVAGGELTVTVRGRGRGGRAQEFAVAAALEIAGLRNTWIAAIGTDGTDGPTEAAGGVVDGATAEAASRTGVNLAAALAENDSHAVLRRVHGHIVTGPTGTNVNDLYLLLAL